jgi:hypothetical protein
MPIAFIFWVAALQKHGANVGVFKTPKLIFGIDKSRTRHKIGGIKVRL